MYDTDDWVKPYRYMAVFLAALIAMIGSFGSWRRGLESFGIGQGISFWVALAADILLITILVSNEVVWTALTRVRRDPPKGTGIRVVISLGVRIGVLYLYGWVSLRGGGDWWDLY